MPYTPPVERIDTTRPVPTSRRLLGRLDISMGNERTLPALGLTDCESVTIRLSDETSGSVIAEVFMPLVVFARAMASRGHQLVEYELTRGVYLAGLEAQVVTTALRMPNRWPHPSHYQTDPAVIDAPALADDLRQWRALGWFPDLDDLRNHHRRLGPVEVVGPTESAAHDWYSVTMRRQVAPETPEEYPPCHPINLAASGGLENSVARRVKARRTATRSSNLDPTLAQAEARGVK